MDMMEKMFLLLLGIFLFCGCGSSRKASKEYLAQKRHYYLVQGYRPVVLPGTKTVAENPFPLSAYEKEKLLDSVAYVCRTYLEKYPDHNLDTWSKPDCEAYLRAKSTQIILQFQPDYYRAYAVPEIRRFRNLYGVPYYTLTYYYDPSREEYGMGKETRVVPGLIVVSVNIGNAQAAGFYMPVLENLGYGFRAPDYEGGLLEDWIPYPYMIWNMNDGRK
ncbi:hypothetical protein [Paraprevotella clara]|jgi:lipoprotein|uniref:hypothetical protein n=2 Tax=Paraprevotella clara TaxID=454154 RepID=UPI00265D19FC|nr:hypothetical protein [Paraprevotella clara]